MANLSNLTGHSNSTLPEDEQAEEVVSTVNSLLNLVSNSVHGSVDVAVEHGVESPTVTSTNLATDTFLANWHFRIGGSATIAGTLVLPSDSDDEKQFAITNNSGQQITVTVSGAGSPSEDAILVDGETAVCHYDGDTNVRKIASTVAETVSGGIPYDIAFFFPTTGDGTILTHVVVRAFTLSANVPGSQAYANTGNGSGDDTATWDIRKNGSSVGTITFEEAAQTGTFTFSSDRGFVAGDRLSVVDLNDGSPTINTSVQGVSVTFKTEI